jgi:membrane protein implicated in regulation of membrane protease activity
VDVALWILLIVVCAVVEIHTHAFMAMFVGLGGAVGMIVAIAGAGFVIQAVVWLIVTVVMLLLLRPFALRHFPGGHSNVSIGRPGATAMYNLTGLVVKDISGEDNPGEIVIRSEKWKAVSDSGEPILSGSKVRVQRALGTTLWVEEIPK